MTTQIDVCICTFRRTSILETLESISKQVLPETVKVRVIVADNDVVNSAEALVKEASTRFNLEILYLHAPSRNISIARNACLEAADREWVAFIDDDEVADPSWIHQLLAHSRDKDVVFGVSRAIYTPGSLEIFKRLDLHSNDLAKEKAIKSGYTSNVLIHLRFVRQHRLRFREELGQTGGEDTIFFLEAGMSGARMGFTSQSIAYELVPAERENWKWLLKRRFRAGQTYGFYLANLQKKSRLYVLMIGATKFLAILVMGIPRVFQVEARYLTLWRATLHLGVAAVAVSTKMLVLYGNNPK